MKTESIIFDVDGTLLDSEKIYMGAWRKTAAEFGYPLPEQALLETRAINTVAAKKIFLKYCGDTFPYDEMIPRKRILTEEMFAASDPETLKIFLSRNDKPITVLAPYNAFTKLAEFGGPHNYVLLMPHSVWSESGITFYAVSAEHSDRTAAGYILDDGQQTFYVSGDTLYNFDVIDDVLDLCEDGVDYAFIPINGVGNNMNIIDASDFAEEIGAKCAVPIHYGLFDDINPKDFDFESKLILEPYVKRKL